MAKALKVPVRNNKGEVVEQITLDQSVFAVPPNGMVVHQALVRQLANARAGSASTKRRGEVSGSTRKLYRQKHTGFARAGSRRSPTRRGGGIAFGPKPRSYYQAMPRKMRRLAFRCVLSSKVSDGELSVIDSFGLEKPVTKRLISVLEALEVGPSVLLVSDEPDLNLVKSARNIPGVKTLNAGMLNIADLMSYKVLLMTVDAVRSVESMWSTKKAVAEAKAS